MFRLTLHNPDFTTAARVAKKINIDVSGKYATAADAGTIDLVTPPAFEGHGVELLALIESLSVDPDMFAKVVINEKTGTVVIGEGVRVSALAISHGDLTLRVSGKTTKKNGKRVINLKEAANVGEIVKAMNSLGVSPKDLITILQSIKAAGALHGELEVL